MDKTLYGWSESFRRVGMLDFVGIYDTDIIEDFNRIEQFGLPTYRRLFIHPKKYLNEFEAIGNECKCDRYYLQLYPKYKGFRKFSLLGFKSLIDSKKFIEEKIKNNLDDYILLLSEFETNVYGGSIMSGENTIIVEMTKGLQTDVAYGKSNVLSCTIDYNRIITFNTDNPFQQSLLYRPLEEIELIGGTSEEKFLRGYFEFAYTEKPGRDALRLIFFDYKIKESYYQV